MRRDEIDWADWYDRNCRGCAIRPGCALEAKILSGNLKGELRAFDKVLAVAGEATLPHDCTVKQDGYPF